MATTKIPGCTSQTTTQKKREISPAKRESRIQRLMWTFEVEGIKLTREQAEKAVDDALSQPLPDF